LVPQAFSKSSIGVLGGSDLPVRCQELQIVAQRFFIQFIAGKPVGGGFPAVAGGVS